eukprot:CAMPEP_0183334962 /NCGR_PEP_ID=MMETSP0164_2-20130417/3404_1 /TAXON_ID=221442 /ORGANISM="Coccolithus pelagicus ssp braarudi, Strain PLY182g" /LENGTH=165 /DNA_ID=CAMNT_0025504211 /DNA_START=190 /DNA_END=687 /DNA_ORIENTATION=-
MKVALVLRSVHTCGMRIAVASNSPAKGTALRILRQFGLAPLISHCEIFPGAKGCKHEHLRRISGAMRVSMRNIIFFDDLARNVRDVQQLGCSAHQVRGGLTAADLIAALRAACTRASSAATLHTFLGKRPVAAPSTPEHDDRERSAKRHAPDCTADEAQLLGNAL